MQLSLRRPSCSAWLPGRLTPRPWPSWPIWLSPGVSDALSERNRIIISDIRLPRVVPGVLVGAALAVSGAVMQGLFRNPLRLIPGIEGVLSGASLGAVSVIVLGGTAPAPLVQFLAVYAPPVASCFGGLTVTLIR